MPKQTADEFLELVNRYPSPHNGQPIRLKIIDGHTFELYFERQRGLQAADISYIFSFVSMGVFVEHMALCARALGHSFSFKLQLPKEQELHGAGAVRFADCQLAWDAAKPDKALLKALQFRQTSRKNYHEGASPQLTEEVIRIAADQHMSLNQLSKQQSEQAIWLNQRAVFDDMFDEPVRRELDHWLRYTQEEKQEKRDGLSYDCMELNGRLMKYIVNHPKVLKMPGMAWFLQQYYVRTMRDASDVFYMLAPFGTEAQAFAVGTVIMRVWRAVAARGYYLHPFGTIMSNHAAHRDFLRLAGVDHESRDQSYLVFIFRCGKSETPVQSLRLPYEEHLILR